MPRRAARCAIPAIVRHRAAAVALGVFCAASAASDPLDLARELADRVAQGAGALMPDAERAQVEAERVVPLDASWPADFLAGLVVEKRFGHEVFPVYARLDNATGAAVFYDADGIPFHEIAPLVPPDEAATWLEDLLGPAASPGDAAWRELSHVVARFLLVPADDLGDYLADAADAAVRARRAPLRSSGSFAVTNLMLTDLSFTPTSVLVTAEWPAGSLPGNAFDLFVSQTLRKPGWETYMGFAAPGLTNITSFVTEIPNDEIPGWVDPATMRHNDFCPVVTNIAASPFDPAVSYTNLHYVCGHRMPPQACFFVAGPVFDTDADGLSDMEEAFVFGTAPDLADTDGDGAADGLEINQGSDPFDPSDGGLPPAAWQLMALPVRLYGDYAAWAMDLRGIAGDFREHTVLAATPGVAAEEQVLLRRGATYRVSLRWLGSEPHTNPDWYCWEARLGSPLQPTGRTFGDHSTIRLPGYETIWGEDWYCENDGGLLTTHVHTKADTAGNVARTKTALLHVLPEMPELERDLVGVACGSGRRVEVAATKRSWHPALEWEIYPTVANGPRLFATEDSTDPATFLTGPRSVWVSSGSVPGVYSILATYPDGAYSTEGHVVVPIVGLDGDFNRNGIPADNADEAEPFGFDDATGMVVACNNNDDNEDGTPDCGDLVVNGADDLADLRKIVVRRLGFPQADLPTGAALTAEIAVTVPDGDLLTFVPASQRIRLFGSNAANAAALGGEAPSLYEGLAADLFGSTDHDLWLEGRFHGASVLLTLRVRLNGEIIGEDAIRVRVAPFEVLSNCDIAEKLYYSGQTGPGWSDFVLDVTNAIIGFLPFEESEWAPFPQDVAELGWVGGTSGRSSVWSMERNGFSNLLSTNVGVFKNPAIARMGGNVEATPPTMTHPHGRIIVGSNLPPAAKAFLRAQEVQTSDGDLIELPVNWLEVGHVDEVLSVVPVVGGTGYKVFLGDLSGAIDLLETELAFCEDWLEDHPNDQDTLLYHIRLSERLGAYRSPMHAEAKAQVESALSQIRQTLLDALNLQSNDLIPFPVLYPLPNVEETGWGESENGEPNSLNMVVLKNGIGQRKCLIPAPLFTVFEVQARELFQSLGYENLALSIIRTEGPHGLIGEAHCATNSRRKRNP